MANPKHQSPLPYLVAIVIIVLAIFAMIFQAVDAHEAWVIDDISPLCDGDPAIAEEFTCTPIASLVAEHTCVDVTCSKDSSDHWGRFCWPVTAESK